MPTPSCPSGRNPDRGHARHGFDQLLTFSGPTSNNVVESASEAVPVLATALTAKGVLSGAPLSGSIMCPACSGDRRLGGVCSEVETLLSDSMTCGIHPVRRISQMHRPAGLPGGVPSATSRASSRIQQRAGDAVRAQHIGRPVQGIAFADGAQINLQYRASGTEPGPGEAIRLSDSPRRPEPFLRPRKKEAVLLGWRLSIG